MCRTSGVSEKAGTSAPFNNLSKYLGMFSIGILACLLTPSAAFAHGVPLEDIQALIEGGNWAFVKSGAKHMVTGYDHILFLFGVMFFLTKMGEIVKFITAFTLGHSITLLFGTLMGISANPYLVDAFIALTVAYKGLENIKGFQRYFHFTPPNLVTMVFLFGLVHGFGLATRLSVLPLGDEGLVLKILSFNLGVELGQIAALTVILVLLAAWRKLPSFDKFSDVANKALIFAGFMLLLFQLHGYAHTAYPDDFGFSEDMHSHAHADMEREALKSRHNSID
ncbi:HupE/UreJ family protein [Kordiimonas pumila]|uniref:HupE/UreJ family protein n=1 Tax=Kordiimonas pumila TaxID=2161677 RepID=A0ABV7D4H6_9PROT|nr:HupE/UreJ family protein [Kordiimonas pumila]